MAQQARERQAITIAPRYTKPEIFAGTDVAWRSLCECYPNAETPEVLMAVMEYCAVRRLDPYKRPVHVVPMWNAKLRRRVQVVMQGINEIEITASRTGAWAGMDMPKWSDDLGPAGLVERTFRGTIDNDDGSTTKIEKTLRFPLWCAVTVYRLVGGEKRAFTEQLFWEECYATAGFKSEVPNERWAKAPRQMLHKCVKAAVLRAAFPEEGLGYTAEEMEDRPTDTGGVTIEGKIDHGDPGLTDRDRQADQVYPPPPKPPADATAGLAALEDQNASRWIKSVQTLLATVATEAEVIAINNHPRVRTALEKAPQLVRENIRDWINEARIRTVVVEEPPIEEKDWTIPSGDDWPDDPIRELLAEIEAMDADGLDVLSVSASWKVKTRDLFPLDLDRVNEAIADRRRLLKGGKT
jgi:phage recombination protein Bet